MVIINTFQYSKKIKLDLNKPWKHTTHAVSDLNHTCPTKVITAATVAEYTFCFPTGNTCLLGLLNKWQKDSTKSKCAETLPQQIGQNHKNYGNRGNINYPAVNQTDVAPAVLKTNWLTCSFIHWATLSNRVNWQINTECIRTTSSSFSVLDSFSWASSLTFQRSLKCLIDCLIVKRTSKLQKKLRQEKLVTCWERKERANLAPRVPKKCLGESYSTRCDAHKELHAWKPAGGEWRLIVNGAGGSWGCRSHTHTHTNTQLQ